MLLFFLLFFFGGGCMRKLEKKFRMTISMLLIYVFHFSSGKHFSLRYKTVNFSTEEIIWRNYLPPVLLVWMIKCCYDFIPLVFSKSFPFYPGNVERCEIYSLSVYCISIQQQRRHKINKISLTFSLSFFLYQFMNM